MRQRLLRGLCLAFMLTLGATGAAYADSYTCNESGNPPPPSVSGDVDITEPGSCTLDYTVTATGEISINAGSDIDIQGLSAGNDITINGSGAVSAGDDITSSDGEVVIYGSGSTDIEAVTGWSYVDIETDADLTIGDDVSSNGGQLYVSAGTTADTQGLYAAGDLNVDTGSTFNSTDIATYLDSGGSIYLYPGDTTTVDGNVQADSSTTILPSAGNFTATGLVEGFTGFVDVEAPNVEIDDNVESAQYTKIIAQDDSIKITGYVSADADDGGGDMLLQAQNDIQTGDIYGGGSATNAFVEIDANLAGGSDEFVIGGDGSSNGVNGTISTGTDDGGGTDPDFIHGGIMITNGTSGSTGGITVMDGSNIAVDATASRSGLILLNAQAGTITLDGGTLESGNSGSPYAGAISLLAQSIVVSGDATIQASQSATAAGSSHTVNIVASSVTYGNLTVSADGDGDGNAAGTALLPVGALTVSSDQDVEDGITVTTTLPNGTFGTNAPISYSGTSLYVSGNGSNSGVSVSGNGMSFSGGVTVQSNGATNHGVTFQYGSGGGENGDLTFSGSGAVAINADGVGGDGGYAYVLANALSISGPSTFSLTANGPSSGDGNGGTVFFGSVSGTFGSSTIGALEANGASAGTGNGGSVTWFPQTANVSLGTNAGDYSVSANGGSTNGDAGTIEVNPNPGNITIDTEGALKTAVLGANGNGGNITLIANPALTVNADSTISVDGQGTGNAGDITVWSQNDLIIGGASEETPALSQKTVAPRVSPILKFSLVAKGTGGNGGNLDAGYQSNVLVLPAPILAESTASGSNGNGGNINIHDIAGTVTVQTELDVNGLGTGNAGSIQIQADTVDLTDTDAKLSALGGLDGAGGTVQVATTHQDFEINKTIVVDAGDNTPTSVFDGSITLNGLPCQQFKTSQSSWPLSYWNCSDVNDQVQENYALTYLAPQTRAELGFSHTQLYTFENLLDYNTFMPTSKNTAAANGVTFTFYPTIPSGYVYSSVFKITPLTNYNELIGHELGHAIGLANLTITGTRPSTTDAYSGSSGFVLNDWFHLDYSYNGSVYIYRDPCDYTGTDPAPPPLVGVIDNTTGGQYCADGELVNPSKYEGFTNSAILQVSEPHIYSTDDTGAWEELYAQSFAYADYAYLNASNPDPFENFAHPTADLMFGTGYFACALGWASDMASGATVGGPPVNPVPDYCTATVPTWYEPFGHF